MRQEPGASSTGASRSGWSTSWTTGLAALLVSLFAFAPWEVWNDPDGNLYGQDLSLNFYLHPLLAFFLGFFMLVTVVDSKPATRRLAGLVSALFALVILGVAIQFWMTLDDALSYGKNGSHVAAPGSPGFKTNAAI